MVTTDDYYIIIDDDFVCVDFNDITVGEIMVKFVTQHDNDNVIFILKISDTELTYLTNTTNMLKIGHYHGIAIKKVRKLKLEKWKHKY